MSTGVAFDGPGRSVGTEEFRALADALPVLVADMVVEAGELRYRLVNRAYEGWFSRPLHEIEGRLVREVVGKAAFDAIQPWIARALAGERVSFERYMPYETGGHRYIHVDYIPRIDTQGTVTGVYSLVQDVTAQKEAETALRESEARVRALTDNLPAGMVYQISTGRDGTDRHFTYVSQSHEKLTGVPAEAVLADPTIPYHLVVPEHRPRLIEGEANAVRDRRPFDIEVQLRRTDGELRWTRIISAPRVQPDGSVIWDGLQIDITEQKLAEQRLRELNETLEERVARHTAERDRVWRNSRDLLVVIDRRWRITAVNPAASTLLGYRVHEAVGRKFSDYVHPDDLRAVARSIRAAATSPVGDFEARLQARNGSWRWFSWSAAPGQDEAYVIGRDISAEKARAAELALAQEALRQSQKLEAMGQLTGGVAHDFNNLLTPIMSSLDLLQRRGVGDERIQRLVDGALQSAERAKTLVQRLLAFARRQPLQPTVVDLPALVEGMTDLISSTSGPRVKLSVDLPPDLPAVLADPNQLEMAILNLAVNARDAMPDGGALTISATAEAVSGPQRVGLASGRYVRLSVADTGVGMDEATLKRAVEPFFSTKGIGKGTGLGLSMVHGLAAQLGGALAISSKPGLGTNVELWLPVTDERARRDSKAGETSSEGRLGRALLVDDDELVLASAAHMLAEIGYAVTEAASAEEALRLLSRDGAPDLLVTDHLMPGATGVDLAREVQERWPGTPVLIITGYADAEGIAPDLPRLTKPFRRAELTVAVAGVVRRAV